MKNPISPIAVGLAVLSVSGFGSIQSAAGQEQPVTAQTGKRNRLIRVKNVLPATMAWWLDPANNQEPIQYRASRTAEEGVLPPAGKDPVKPLGDYRLPAGVDRLVAIDPQNAILAAGTDAGISELEKVIASLDKVQKQVEVEVQYIVIGGAELKKLNPENFTRASEKEQVSWAVLTPHTDTKGTPEIAPKGFVSRSAITEMTQNLNARVITAPRVTAFDALSAELRSETTRPFIVGPESGIPTYTDPKAQCLLFWSSGMGMTVRPTINTDRTINLTLAPGLNLKLKVQAEEDSKLAPREHLQANPFEVQANDSKVTGHNGDGLKTVWQRQLGGVLNLPNIKSGQTLAVLGLKSDSLLTRDPADKSEPSNVLLLVRANIVRRAGDDEDDED